MESIAFVATSWASGVNAYLTLLILGVAGRYGWAETPASLQQGWVIIVAGVAFVVEFVVDKVPLLDSAWDAMHTIIRPIVGGLSGVAIAGASFGKPQAFIAAAALALAGHATKATSRLAINMSPELVSCRWRSPTRRSPPPSGWSSPRSVLALRCCC
jgi:Domain of unknown function (DUF4126)